MANDDVLSLPPDLVGAEVTTSDSTTQHLLVGRRYRPDYESVRRTPYLSDVLSFVDTFYGLGAGDNGFRAQHLTMELVLSADARRLDLEFVLANVQLTIQFQPQLGRPVRQFAQRRSRT